MKSDPAILGYASPASPADRPIGPRVWAAAAITFAGIGLLVIGGCFLVGVMLIVSNSFGGVVPGGLSSKQQVLVSVLYMLAAFAFGGGVWILVVGLRGLMRLLRP